MQAGVMQRKKVMYDVLAGLLAFQERVGGFSDESSQPKRKAQRQRREDSRQGVPTRRRVYWRVWSPFWPAAAISEIHLDSGGNKVKPISGMMRQ